jgi:uncharacterized repeat protein (TIGR03803 family)
MKTLFWARAVALGWSLAQWRKTLVSYCVLTTSLIAVLLIANITQAESARKLLHTFRFSPGGNMPAGPMIFDAAGNLYGTTVVGGPSNLGVVFELSIGSDGSVRETVLHAFSGPDGANPRGGLVMDAAGNLYGATNSGGSTTCISFSGLGCGVVFELTHSEKGWTETVLHSFTENYSQDTYQPVGELVLDSGGNLYGVGSGGGSNSGGAVFELTLTSGTWEYAVVYNFDPSVGVTGPVGPLTFDTVGNLYGAAPGSGVFQKGAIFELTPVVGGGWTETDLYSFLSESDGGVPNGRLVVDSGGNVYGSAQYGGANGYGVIFRLKPPSGNGWTESVLHSFQGADGRQPLGGLTADPSGDLYGTTNLGGNLCDIFGEGCGTVFRLNASGLTVLHRFSGGNDASYPLAAPNLDAAGNLYGTTSGGQDEFGTAFRLAPMPGGGVKETIIHTFADVDGQLPQGSMSVDALGNPYGTTVLGGSHNVGTVFELTSTPSGALTEKVIYSFIGNPGENDPGAGGSEPTGGLLLDAAGNIFGTTFAGGNATCRGQTCGTVFELSPTAGGWTETTLYAFNGNDGGQPNGGLVSDSEGNLYGTTPILGGAFGHGAVFELTRGPTGWTESVLYAFQGKGDGGVPFAGVILDDAGNLYGTTEEGGAGQGCFDGCGTVFELIRASGWTEQVLHSFGGGNDGYGPGSPLTFDEAGNLYGTTGAGGPGGAGTVFELTPASGGRWTESVLYAFSGPDGNDPYLAGVTFDAAGNIYGATTYGGSGSCNNATKGCGVVFKLSPTGNGKWRESGLYSFTGGADGATPEGGLVSDSLGNFYGTAQAGGAGCGVVFGFTP